MSHMKLDIDRLIVSRLLVTASPAAAESLAAAEDSRRVSKSTQTIVIDTEGEFATLRELRDMVLAGPQGEVPAEPRSAALLCRRLMELNLSAVIDVSELKRHDKQRSSPTSATRWSICRAPLAAVPRRGG
jgi:hypothetical protein